MTTVKSKDGTQIAFDCTGSGPAIILVDGALGYRGNFGLDQLAGVLAGDFSAYAYDRRGRGESGDTLPYALEREIEDIEALVEHAGGRAFLYGVSSGASLVLEAGLQLQEKVRGIALYEPPYNSDPGAVEAWKAYTRELGELLAAGRKADAVALFMRLTGAGENDVEMARQSPEFQKFAGAGHTLAYDHIAILGETAEIPVEKAAEVRAPALVMAGSASYPFMLETARKLAAVLPRGELRILEGQTHEAAEAVLASALREFFLPLAAGR